MTTTRYDLLVRNARIIDGTGGDAFIGHVGIAGGRIVEVAHASDGPPEGDAARVIEADGLLLTPGFVDIHTHYDGQVCWDKMVTPAACTA